MHHPRRRNVTTLMVGLKKKKKRSHTQKSHQKSGEPQRYSWGTHKKKNVFPSTLPHAVTSSNRRNSKQKSKQTNSSTCPPLSTYPHHHCPTHRHLSPTPYSTSHLHTPGILLGDFTRSREDKQTHPPYLTDSKGANYFLFPCEMIYEQGEAFVEAICLRLTVREKTGCETARALKDKPAVQA